MNLAQGFSDSPEASAGVEEPPRIPGGRTLALELIAGVAAVLIFGLPSLAFPLGADQGQQAAIGRLIAEGHVLYRDLWDNRSPGIYLFAALAWRLGLDGMSGVRIFDLVWQMLTASGLGLMAWRLSRLRGSAALAAAFYGFTYYGQGNYWHTCQPDGKLALFAAAGWLLISDSDRLTPWRLASAGALWGCAFLTKYPGLLLALPLVAALPAVNRPRWIRMLLWFGGAFLVTVGAWLGYCAAVGSLRALWADTVLFNRGYRLLGAEISGIAAAAHEALAIALEHREVLAPLILVPLAIPYTGRRAFRVPLAWLVSGLGMFVVQGKFFSMHYYSVLAPLALLSAIVWCAVATRVREHRPWRQRATWIAALLLSLAAGYRTAFTWEHSAAAALRATESEEARTQYYANFPGAPVQYSVTDFLEVVRHLKSQTDPSQPLLVWAYQPSIYFLAGMKPSTRFVSDIALTSTYAPLEYREQFYKDLADHPPAYIVVALRDSRPWAIGHALTSEQVAASFEPLAQLLSRCEPVMENDTYRLCRVTTS